ncbi:hypothetical protein B0H21DRAFT_195537 [Amylocystis lapponica]|nr:hypothetical protein B0H21DRAFT_195537 [Amylocystis lapponica]
MARGSITPFPFNGSDDTLSHLHSASTSPVSAASSSTSPIVARRPSSSSFQSVARLFESPSSAPDRDSMSQPRPLSLPPARARAPSATSPDDSPILTLKLSGPSFLDNVLWDKQAREPLYILETDRERTNIYRLDSQLREAGRAASIQWPPNVSGSSKGKGKSGKTIQMGSGAWRDVEDFLKLGPLGGLTSRKFNLPHYPHTLKWKLVPGNAYSCSSSGTKGPIAILDAAVLSAPPRLKIYKTLVDSAHARSQGNHHGVPFLLLDYLVVTALLLCTTTQEWLDRPATVRMPGSSSYTVRRWLALIHNEPLPPEPESASESEPGTARSHGPDDPPSPSTPFSPTTTTGSPMWDTQSGVTSWSGGSASGSGSGSSDHPVTPSTPATSLNSPFRYGAGQEDIPPVPPLPSIESHVHQQSRLVVANPTPSRPPSFAALPAHPHTTSSVPPYFQSSVPSPLPSSSSYSPSFAFRTNSPQSASGLRQLPAIPQAPAAPDSPRSVVRASLRRSIRGMPPPPPPPPQAVPLPLPPKLASELPRASTSSAGPSTVPMQQLSLALDEEARMIGLAGDFHSLGMDPVPAPRRQSAELGAVHTDAGGVRASTAYPAADGADAGAGEEYEMPPPAYDAIDFSVRIRVPRPRAARR